MNIDREAWWARQLLHERARADVAEAKSAALQEERDELWALMKVTTHDDALSNVNGATERIKFTESFESLRFQLTAMSEKVMWQRIETAPKDGTLVLVWTPARGAFVAWNKGYGWHTEPGVYVRRPTHWMPLPDPLLEAALSRADQP